MRTIEAGAMTVPVLKGIKRYCVPTIIVVCLGGY